MELLHSGRREEVNNSMYGDRARFHIQALSIARDISYLDETICGLGNKFQSLSLGWSS